MASPVTPYATKGRRVAIQLESTPGTPDAVGASTFMLPATDFSYSVDRGTGVIARDAVLDGYPGGICYTPGSRGASMSFTTELHDFTNPAGTADYYLSHLLLGCGFAADDTAAPVTSYAPSHEVISGASTIPLGGTEGPQSLTVYHYQTDITGITDYQNRFIGSTGALTLNLNAGEIATATVSMVGTMTDAPDWMGTADPALPTLFDASVSCKPYVVRNATIALVDDGGQPADIITLANLTINFNAETPENQDPTQTYGFGISPVIFPSAPTVSFTIGATEENNGVGGGAFQGFLQQFREGAIGALAIQLDTGDNSANTMTIAIDQLQYTGVTWGDAGGYTTYEIEAVAVRNPGSPTPPVSITIDRQ